MWPCNPPLCGVRSLSWASGEERHHQTKAANDPSFISNPELSEPGPGSPGAHAHSCSVYVDKCKK